MPLISQPLRFVSLPVAMTFSDASATLLLLAAGRLLVQLGETIEAGAVLGRRGLGSVRSVPEIRYRVRGSGSLVQSPSRPAVQRASQRGGRFFSAASALMWKTASARRLAVVRFGSF